jgi:hypothetical protein
MPLPYVEADDLRIVVADLVGELTADVDDVVLVRPPDARWFAIMPAVRRPAVRMLASRIAARRRVRARCTDAPRSGPRSLSGVSDIPLNIAVSRGVPLGGAA